MKADIRLAIIAEMERRHITTNQLAAEVSKHIHRSHVYDFIAGNKELTTDKASRLLRALGLAVQPRAGNR